MNIDDTTETLQNGLDQAAEQLERLRGELTTFEDRARSLIQERPLTCLLAALAGGYVLARLAAPRR
ncbi:MAG: hypothetical protein KIT14_09755 [bacterium]|nr:hypothetical protein [bacterium]